MGLIDDIALAFTTNLGIERDLNETLDREVAKIAKRHGASKTEVRRMAARMLRRRTAIPESETKEQG